MSETGAERRRYTDVLIHERLDKQEEFEHEMLERLTKIEGQLRTLFYDNGEPGRLNRIERTAELNERRISWLEKWLWRVSGGTSVLMGLLGLFEVYMHARGH